MISPFINSLLTNMSINDLWPVWCCSRRPCRWFVGYHRTALASPNPGGQLAAWGTGQAYRTCHWKVRWHVTVISFNKYLVHELFKPLFSFYVQWQHYMYIGQTIEKNVIKSKIYIWHVWYSISTNFSLLFLFSLQYIPVGNRICKFFLHVHTHKRNIFSSIDEGSFPVKHKIIFKFFFKLIWKRFFFTIKWRY